MNTLKELWEAAVRLKNRIRIWFLQYFTDRVKRIEVKDEQGRTHTAVVERQEEKTCQHTKIEQIVGTFWQCIDCRGAYFEITYKVMLNRGDLLGFCDTIAKHLGTGNETETLNRVLNGQSYEDAKARKPEDHEGQ